MLLRLTALPATTKGIYNTDAGPKTLPVRFRYLHPDAAHAFLRLEAATGGLVYTDILRSAADSLKAYARKRGVQPPGFSGHNFGLSVDVAVDATLKLYGWDYGQLLGVLEQYGWHCHRRDGARGYQQSEHWHFNFLGAQAEDHLRLAKSSSRTWTLPLESVIDNLYGAAFKYSASELQEKLRRLRFYTGAIDGDVGPKTRAALEAFRAAWMKPGVSDAPSLYRVLAFVAADREIV